MIVLKKVVCCSLFSGDHLRHFRLSASSWSGSSNDHVCKLLRRETQPWCESHSMGTLAKMFINQVNRLELDMLTSSRAGSGMYCARLVNSWTLLQIPADPCLFLLLLINQKYVPPNKSSFDFATDETFLVTRVFFKRKWLFNLYSF